MLLAFSDFSGESCVEYCWKTNQIHIEVYIRSWGNLKSDIMSHVPLLGESTALEKYVSIPLLQHYGLAVQ